jgi:hypothetical protein
MNQKLSNLMVVGLSSLSGAQGSAADLQESSNSAQQIKDVPSNDGLMELQAQWIKVPQRCKDRSVTSDPVKIERELVSMAAARIHHSLGTV